MVMRAEHHYRTRLTNADVRYIRRVYRPRRGVVNLLKRFRITYSVLNDIVRRRSWRSVH
jgi:hypothetical protein